MAAVRRTPSTVVRASTHTMLTATGSPSVAFCAGLEARLLHRVQHRAGIVVLHGRVVAPHAATGGSALRHQQLVVRHAPFPRHDGR